VAARADGTSASYASAAQRLTFDAGAGDTIVTMEGVQNAFNVPDRAARGRQISADGSRRRWWWFREV
jgi:hypothetical protein